MALAASGLVLGLTLGNIVAPGDPANLTAYGGMSTALGTWLPANCIVLPGTLVAAGSAVTGAGVFVFTGSENDLGFNLAIAAGSPPTDTAAIEKWTAIAGVLITWIGNFGQALPTAFVAVPAGGPVTGTGTLAFTNLIVGYSFAEAVGTLDAANVATWSLIGPAILTHIATQATILPTAFASPGGGGALTGVGSLL